MTKYIRIIFTFAVLLSLCGCSASPEPTQEPSSPPTQITAPSTEPSTGATEPSMEATTEATEPSSPTASEVMEQAGFYLWRGNFIYAGTDPKITIPYWNICLTLPEGWLDQVYVVLDYNYNGGVSSIMIVNRDLTAAYYGMTDSSVSAILDWTAFSEGSSRPDWSINMLRIKRTKTADRSYEMSHAPDNSCLQCAFGEVVAESGEMTYYVNRQTTCESCGKEPPLVASARDKLGEHVFSDANGYWVPTADEIAAMITLDPDAP